MSRITTIGDVNVDWIVEVENVDLPIRSLSREANNCIITSLGGGGAIFAIAAQDAGFESHLLGRVGNDVLGDFALQTLVHHGVKLSVARDCHHDTGKILVVRDRSDRKMMVSHRGANVMFITKDVNWEILKESDIIYISGYALLEEPQSRTCLDIIHFARQTGVQVILDIVPHRVFSGHLSTNYSESLSLVQGVVLELGTAHGLLGSKDLSEHAVLQKLLLTYNFVVLSPDNDSQIIATRTRTFHVPTQYSQAKERLGYLDRLTAKVMINYLRGNYN